MDLVMEDLASDGSEPIYPPLHYASKMLRVLLHALQARRRRSNFPAAILIHRLEQTLAERAQVRAAVAR